MADEQEPTSLDFLVLNSTSEMDNAFESPRSPDSTSDADSRKLDPKGDVSSGLPGPRGNASSGLPTHRPFSNKDREAAIHKLFESCGPDDGNRTPLRIVLIGKHGSGKSSFINSYAAGLSEDRWREYSRTGLRSDAAPISIVNQRFEKSRYAKHERFNNVLLPTLIDVAGLTDDPDERIEDLLKLLFYGHIEEDEAIMKVYTDCRNLSKEGIRQKYRTCYENMRVDRVIFLASADTQLPLRLMKFVYNAAHPNFDKLEKRDIPLFGVLTHQDLISEASPAFQEKREIFKKELGLNETRLLICSNYCDRLDPTNQRSKKLDPLLDVPILEFIQEVCDDAREVIRDNEALPGTETKQEEQENQINNAMQGLPNVPETNIHQNLRQFQVDMAIAALAGVVTILLLLFVFLPGPDESIKDQCRSETMINQSVCSQVSTGATFRRWMLDLGLAVFVSAGVFFVRQNKRA